MTTNSPHKGEARTEITALNLSMAGYREHPDRLHHSKALWQKRFDDEHGKRFFINFREWDRPNGTASFDAEFSGETSDGGHARLTVKEPTIEAVEARIEKFWRDNGAIYYEGGPSS